MIAIDTNILVYAHRAALREHRAARHALERAIGASDGWGIAQPCAAEFWSVVTHPTASGRPSTPTEAHAFLGTLLGEGQGHLWLPTTGFGERLGRAEVRAGVRGPRIFDLQIALIAHEAGARELWSRDRSFVTVPGLRVVDPLS